MAPLIAAPLLAAAIAAGLTSLARYAAGLSWALSDLGVLRVVLLAVSVCGQGALLYLLVESCSRVIVRSENRGMARLGILFAMCTFAWGVTGAFHFALTVRFGGQWVLEFAWIPALLVGLWSSSIVAERLVSRMVGGHPADANTVLRRDVLYPFLVLVLALAEDYHRFAVFSPAVRKYFFAIILISGAMAVASVLVACPKRIPRWLGCGVLVAIAGVLAWFDATQFPRLYRLMHVAAWVGVVGVAARLASASWKPESDERSSWVARSALVAGCAALIVLPLVDAPTRFELMERTSVAGRIAASARVHLADVLLPDAPPPHTVKRFPGAPASANPGRRPSLLLLTVDALRDDCLDSKYMPAAAAFAKRGTRFTRARASFPGTHKSLRSAMSGTLEDHPARSSEGVLNGPTRFVWHALAEAGFNTQFVGCFARQAYVPRRRPLVHVPRHVGAEAVADRALVVLEELEKDEAPFALWVHFFDPHIYDPAGRRGGESQRELYDLSVLEVDQALARLFPVADRIASKRPLHVVFFADHGEEFGEHGGGYHNSSAYEEQVRVPFAFIGPRIRAGSIDQGVGLIDLAPTMLDLAGLAIPDGLNGRSLKPALGGAVLDATPVLIDVQRDGTHEQRSVVIEPWKLIRNEVSGTLELYHLESDPSETRSVPHRLDETPAELRRALGL